MANVVNPGHLGIGPFGSLANQQRLGQMGNLCPALWAGSIQYQLARWDVVFLMMLY